MAFDAALFTEFDHATAGFYHNPRIPERNQFYPCQFIEHESSLPATWIQTAYPARNWFAVSLFAEFVSAGASYYTKSPPPKPPKGGLVFSPAVERSWTALPYFAGDDSIELSFDLRDITFYFPGSMDQVEIKYPVVPVNQTNRVLFQMDSKEWRSQQKTEYPSTRRISTLRFVVDRTYMATFMGDLHSHRATVFRLLTPGYTPFGINSSDNMVYVLSHSSPSPSDPGCSSFVVDVTFRFDSVTP